MRRLLIVGAGHAGIACVEHLLKLKHECRITVFEGSLGRRDSEQVKSDATRREWLRKSNLEVRAAVCVEVIDRHAKVVRGCDGSRTTYDTLILAAGVSNPALGARGEYLEVRTGVVVNDFMEASDAHVYALGKGAEHRGHIYSDDASIQQQARVLAEHIAGRGPAPFLPSLLATPGVVGLATALTPSAASPGVSADFAPRSEDQTPAPANRSALVGAV